MKLVIALGGNALGKTPYEQLELVKETAKSIVKLVKDGNKVVVTHGNGPQVGMINLAMEHGNNDKVIASDMPFAECGSMSQGYIGYHLTQAIQNELKKENLDKECVSVVTQVVVDKNDKGFSNPTKPIGMFYTKEAADKIAVDTGYIMKEDAGRGYRRVVASPQPMEIVEIDAINDLVEKDKIVICCGGGGIPVTIENGILSGIDAVIDKDNTACLLATKLNADMLMILTAVDEVCINYNKENEQKLRELTVSDCEKYIAEEQFAKGSMLPKIEACVRFVKNTNNKAIITSLLSSLEALKGERGTLIK